MNAVSLALRTQRINTAVYVKVLSEPMNFSLSDSPSKEMGDRTRLRKTRTREL